MRYIMEHHHLKIYIDLTPLGHEIYHGTTQPEHPCLHYRFMRYIMAKHHLDIHGDITPWSHEIHVFDGTTPQSWDI